MSDTTTATEKTVFVGIDFGTTYGKVAFVVQDRGESGDNIHVHRLKSIDNYPDDPCTGFGSSPEVPVLLYYSPISGEIEWGYTVKENLLFPEHEIHNHDDNLISRIKLLLDSGEVTTQIRQGLEAQAQALKKAGFVNKAEDFLDHFLVRWMDFVWEKLQEDEDVKDADKYEISLCLPTHWTVTSRHKLCKAVVSAVRHKWAIYQDTSPQIFTVREPEAGANSMLSAKANQLRLGENILVIDAGGATVEMSQYKVTRKHPLRFEETGWTSAGTCGSSLSNINFKNYNIDRLAEEHYLKENFGVSIGALLEAKALPKFEYRTKRNLDFSKPNVPDVLYGIDTLRANPAKNFQTGRLIMTGADLRAVFAPLFSEVETLLQEQFDQAEDSAVISQVLITGGFSDSKPLQNTIIGWLKNNEWKAQLAPPHPYAGISIAQGAVLRALNKKYGPTRYVRSSFAIIRHVREEEGEFLPNAKLGIDGDYHAFDNLDWFIQKDTYLAPGQRFFFIGIHCFSPKDKKWIVEEAIYHCPRRMPTQLANIKDPSNAGAELLDRKIKIDVTCLRNENKITPTTIAFPKTKGKRRKVSKCWEVVVCVSIELVEEHLHDFRVSASWSPEMQDAVMTNPDTVRNFSPGEFNKSLGNERTVCIAGHFEPSTA